MFDVYYSDGPPALKALEVYFTTEGSCRACTLILSKGIANFEALVEVLSGSASSSKLEDVNVVFCLAAKCSVLAELFNVRIGQPVVVSLSYLRSVLGKT